MPLNWILTFGFPLNINVFMYDDDDDYGDDDDDDDYVNFTMCNEMC